MRTKNLNKFQEFITVTEAAKLAKTGRMTIYNLINSGKLKAVSFSPQEQTNRWRIPLDAWNEFMERQLV